MIELLLKANLLGSLRTPPSLGLLQKTVTPWAFGESHSLGLLQKDCP